ncbi:MAG TPA: MBL fold metallo-hydrolase [Pyrinomonadaceae bacterium]|nr:MBL fold metallo-hydrolase [Pyrinomonadaceae bacterium]HNU08635.1 MBL fold metallo-hydrolase [Pyrinomonadaceae bacterium]
MNRFLAGLVITGLLVTGAFAHGDGRHDVSQQDVTVKTTKVSGNIYMLQGRGGNIGVLVGPEGILMIDDDYRAVSEKLRDALKELGSGSPRYIFNTHWHDDHAEGNKFFGKDSIIVAHKNVRQRLSQVNQIFGQKTVPYEGLALPVVTYTESMSIHFGGEEVRAVHYPNGHTDGDSVIFFVTANVVHMGDDFFVAQYPFVDLENGGSVQGLIKHVGELIKQLPADVKIIPGHGPLATLDDLKQFHSLLVETTDYIRKEMRSKKSLDEIKKGGLPEKFKPYGQGFVKTDRWIEFVYKSYSK